MKSSKLIYVSSVMAMIFSLNVYSWIGPAGHTEYSPSTGAGTITLRNGNTATIDYNSTAQTGTITGPYDGVADITGGYEHAIITGGPWGGTAEIMHAGSSPQIAIYNQNGTKEIDVHSYNGIEYDSYVKGDHIEGWGTYSPDRGYYSTKRIFTSPYGGSMQINRTNGDPTYLYAKGPHGGSMGADSDNFYVIGPNQMYVQGSNYPGYSDTTLENSGGQVIATGTGTPRSSMTYTGMGYYTGTPGYQVTRTVTPADYTQGYYTPPVVTGPGTYTEGYYTAPVVTGPGTTTFSGPNDTYSFSRTYDPTTGIAITGSENTNGGTLSYYEGNFYYNGNPVRSNDPILREIRETRVSSDF